MRHFFNRISATDKMNALYNQIVVHFGFVDLSTHLVCLVTNFFFRFVVVVVCYWISGQKHRQTDYLPHSTSIKKPFAYQKKNIWVAEGDAFKTLILKYLNWILSIVRHLIFWPSLFKRLFDTKDKNKIVLLWNNKYAVFNKI